MSVTQFCIAIYVLGFAASLGGMVLEEVVWRERHILRGNSIYKAYEFISMPARWPWFAVQCWVAEFKKGAGR